MDLNALMLANALTQWVLPAIWLVIGLGLVIFVHELGHFLVAKAVGIKVEKFSLGFGPKVFGFTRGETEYRLSALPLGGYVKMLGQEDFKPTEDNVPDPRAYNNKSVGARVAVVSAGVVMNVLFAGILFIIVCLMGINFPAAVVGGLSPGYPAASAKITWDEPIPLSAAGHKVVLPSTAATAPATATAPASGQMVRESIGLQTGDEILSVNGKETKRWQTVAVRSVLATPDDVFTFRIRRQINGRSVEGTALVGVKPDPEEEKRLTFGLGSSPKLVLDEMPDVRGSGLFKKDDRIIAVNGLKVSRYAEYEAAVEAARKSPVTITVERQGKQVDVDAPLIIGGSGRLYRKTDKRFDRLDAYLLEENPAQARLRFRDGSEQTLPADQLATSLPKDNLLTILGLSPRVQVAAVAEGTPADRARHPDGAKGFEPGDIIANYGDLGRAPSYKELQELNLKYAGKGANIVMIRNGKMMPAVWVVPKEDDGRAVMGFTATVPSDELVVGGIEPGSPAAWFGEGEPAKPLIQPADSIEGVNSMPLQTWQELFFTLDGLQDQDVVLNMKRGSRKFDVPLGKLNRFAFDRLAYSQAMGFTDAALMVQTVWIQMSNPADAIAWGASETWDFTLDTYVSLQRLFGGTVSHKELRGPLGIGSAAIKMGQAGFGHMIYFMAIISISLAVINFLPIPVVDGGHVVFLAIEKIRGKPIPVKVINIAQYVGLALLLLVFIVATSNDIGRWIKGHW